MTSLALMRSLCVNDVLNCLKTLRALHLNLGPKPFALCQVPIFSYNGYIDSNIVVSLNYSRPSLNF